MKKLTISILAVTFVAIVFLATSSSYTWLLINGSQAEKYAVALLQEEKVPSPDWMIDLVVIKENGIVTFNNHNPTSIYAYSPNTKPTTENILWSHAWGNWYVGTIKT